MNVCTQLPDFVADKTIRDAVDNHQDEKIKMLLRLCLRSRPLFAGAVADAVKEFALKKLASSKEEVLAFVEGIREKVMEVRSQKRGCYSKEGCYGYIAAMLTAGLLEEAPVSINKVPSFIRLIRKAGTSDRDAKLFLETDLSYEFRALTFFPNPQNDFLLYLGLAGSCKYPGLIYRDVNLGFDKRISAAKLVNDIFPNHRPRVPGSANVKMPEFSLHEMVVCAAFMTACNSGALSGMTLEELVTRFVAELINSHDQDHVKLKTVAEIAWAESTSFRGQFMWPYDTEMPTEIDELLNTVHATRPANSLQFDAATYKRSGDSRKGFKVLVEAKSTLNRSGVRNAVEAALARQDSKAKVGFIVIDHSVKDLEDFRNLDNFRVLNREQRDGNSWKEGGSLGKARFFNVKIDSSKQVVLEPKDGKTARSATRLIFLISVDDINETIRRDKPNK